MIPLKDINPTERTPFVTIGIIIACVLVFLKEISLPPESLDALVKTYGFVPARFFSSNTSLLEKIIPIFTSMFLHGSFMHIIGNMLYLWIFGNNIEDKIGHFSFLLLYLLSGIAAAMLQGIANTSSSVPMIGASGAIAGTLGAYLVLFPGARILTMIVFYFITFQELPAFIVISVWFLIQFLSSLGSLSGINTGVAYLAHVGGFIAGLILIHIFPKKKRPKRYLPEDYL
ncbi:MAG: rhomboid family intramembrane serine protease [Actinobacteria bacterium]|nr:rhomboid family intramembrane serine protease [Actinomycetota bacterium]